MSLISRLCWRLIENYFDKRGGVVKRRRCFKCGRFVKFKNAILGPPDFCNSCFEKATMAANGAKEFQEWCYLQLKKFEEKKDNGRSNKFYGS